MKLHRELVLSGTEQQLDLFITELTKFLTDPWRRNRDSENFNKDILDILQTSGYCLEYSNEPRCTVVLIRNRDKTKVSLEDISPAENRDLTLRECNHIVMEFYRFCAAKVFNKADLKILLTPETRNIGEWISQTCVNKLETFIDSKNKNDTSMHPSNEIQWHEFLLCAHQEKAELDHSILETWFIEDHKWPEDVASHFAWRYTISRSLLDFASSINEAK